ncbi:MAG: hypothetical protein CMN77_12595 [Spirochaetaceae bacterium]|nr:hypothetical protein [Spirochaetaceae bacterium]|tara:strand:+ start:3729 stop:4241 length:513 start_codon:yes stop_codon:yes gene_type:complete
MVYRLMHFKRTIFQSVRASALTGILLVSVFGAVHCGGEPDGLAPGEVMQGFLQAIANNDESKARDFVTFKSKLLVAVAMKIIAAAEQSPENAEKNEVDDLRKDLSALSDKVKCDEPAPDAEMVECHILNEDMVKFPLVKTSDGWRVDLFTMIEKNRSDATAEEPAPTSEN